MKLLLLIVLLVVGFEVNANDGSPTLTMLNQMLVIADSGIFTIIGVLALLFGLTSSITQESIVPAVTGVAMASILTYFPQIILGTLDTELQAGDYVDNEVIQEQTLVSSSISCSSGYVIDGDLCVKEEVVLDVQYSCEEGFEINSGRTVCEKITENQNDTVAQVQEESSVVEKTFEHNGIEYIVTNIDDSYVFAKNPYGEQTVFSKDELGM